MCTRATQDPLLRLFFEKYHVHVLTAPRENVDVGQVYVQDRGVIMAPGDLASLLSRFELPSIHRAEAMADLSGKLTNRVKLSAAFTLLEGVAAAIGLPGYFGGLKAEGAWDNTRAVRFRFSHGWRDWLDVVQLGTALMEATLRSRHPLVVAGRRYFVVTAVLRTTEISVEFSEADSRLALVDAEPAVGAKGSASVSEDGYLRVESKVPLAFGVELHELEYAEPHERFVLKAVRLPVTVRNKRGARRRQTFAPAEIGGRRGSLLLDVKYPA